MNKAVISNPAVEGGTTEISTENKGFAQEISPYGRDDSMV